MNWNMFNLVHVIVHVIYFKRDWNEKKFRPASAFTLILCWSSDAPPPLVQQKCKLLAYSTVQVCMSSSTICGAFIVSSQLDTHIAEVLAGVTLSVNAFKCWRARGPSRLARLVKDLTCAAASQAYVERIFSVCGLLYCGRRRNVFRSVEMSVCLKLRQCWKKRTSCPR